MQGITTTIHARRLGGLVLGLVTVACLTLGTTDIAGAARDTARLARVAVSSRMLHPGEVVTIDAAARDRGSNDYAVSYAWDVAKVDLIEETCAGSVVGSPSPDTPACEYDDVTTTTRAVTHTTGRFQVATTATGRFSVTVCAASMSNPPVPFPDGGSCRTLRFRVVA